MKQEWIQPYVDNVGKEVCPRGTNSYSRNLAVALKFAFKDPAEDKKPVLFLALKLNYSGKGSVMMNGEAYSSYPSEGEMLLVEGCWVYILGFEEDFEVNSKHESLKGYYKKKLMVVYLYTW